MSDYFVENPQQSKYFTSPKTAAQSTKTAPKDEDKLRSEEVQRFIESAEKTYGTRKTSVAVRRYGIR